MNKEINKDLDILGKTVLQSIQGYKGFEKAVIAGGYTRDLVLGGAFKDIDIFVPVLSIENGKNFLNNLPEGWKLINNKPIQTIKDKYKLIERVLNILDFKYLEVFDVQIMNTTVDSKDFPEDCIHKFSYGIDQCWSSGEEIKSSKEFQFDWTYSRATLLKLQHLEQLPVHMKKFFRLQEKYPYLNFHCSNLEIRRQKGSEVKINPKYSLNANELAELQSYLQPPMSDNF